MASLSEDLLESHPIFVCEGVCERYIVETLKEEGLLAFPPEQIRAITNTRGAKKIQEEYLNYNYEWPVSIIRLLDSKKENFKLDRLYRDRFEVCNIYTRPEIEMLNIINEGQYNRYTNKFKSSVKPSTFCMDELDLGNVKAKDFPKSYWNTGSLVAAIKEYKRLMKLEKNELCLADLLNA